MYFKPLVSSVVAVALERYVINETNYTKNAYFGGAMFIGNVLGQMVAPSVNILGDLPSINEELYDGNTLAKRIEEVGISVGSVYVINKYVLNNDIYAGEFTKRVGIIVASQVVGEYVSDYMNSRPMAYLQDDN